MVKILKAIRNNLRINQQLLTNAIGTTQQPINHKVESNIYTLIDLADYFYMTVDYLVGRSYENDQPLNDSNSLTSKYSKLNQSENIYIDTLADTYINLNKYPPA